MEQFNATTVGSAASGYQITDKEFERLVGYMKNTYGIDLSKKRILIQSRLANILRERGLKNFNDYINIVFNDKTGTEVTTLLNKLTTNHSYFMREQEHFAFLKSDVLPSITKRHAVDKTINIWSAGCSAGQEVYTTAMAVDEYFGLQRSSWKVNFLASDISMNVLDQARAGVYSVENLKDIPPAWKTKYFTKEGENFKVIDKIRTQVTFKTINLMDNFVFPKPFDLVMCRNVMIYFDKPTKDALVERFYKVTANEGYLYIGHSEVIDKEKTSYKYIKPAIYQKRGV